MTLNMRRLGAVAAVCVGLFVVGCGSDDSDSGESGDSGSDSFTADAQKKVDELYTGTYESPPSDSPPAAEDKSVWLISCGQSIVSCSDAIGGAEEAAGELGWESNIYDTKGDPTTAGTGVRQAIAADADGIFVYFLDCSYMAKPLEEAQDAGIPVVAAESFDCDAGDPGAPALFTSVVSYVEGAFPEWVRKFNEAQGYYAVATTDGSANSLFFSDDVSLAAAEADEGYDSILGQCSGCENEIINYSFDEIFSGVQQQTEQKLLQSPDANVVTVAYDGILVAGVEAAVSAATTDIDLIGGEGGPAVMDLARDGKVTAGVGLPNAWEGYSGMDSLNRIFADEEPETSGIGIQIWDQDHNLPETGGYEPPIDFRADYQAAWGVEG